MCGITYIEKPLESDGEHTLSLLSPRGPDEQRSVHTPFGSLHAARLAITGIAGGSQPVGNARGNVLGCLNGEIYNHEGLRNELEQKGITFSSDCDTEVMVNAVAERGNKAAGEFDGQFSYLCMDQESGKVRAARDPFGIKPLYFGMGSRGFVAGSTVRVLLDTGVKASDLRVLPQGCALSYEPGKEPQISRYYDVRDHMDRPQCTANDMYNLLMESVRKRIPEEVEYASILSGLDSSSVTWAAHQFGRPPSQTFTIASSPDSEDLVSADLLSTQLGIENQVGFITPEYIANNLREVIRTMGTAMFYPIINALPTLLLADMVKDSGAKVLLSGTGADETFIGYPYLFNQFDPCFIEGNAKRLISTMYVHECHRGDSIFGSQGLEERLPFLDRGLVESVLSMPFSERLPGYDATFIKSVLKEIMSGKIPEQIVKREKAALYQSTGMIDVVASFVETYGQEFMSDKDKQEIQRSVSGTSLAPWLAMGGDFGLIIYKLFQQECPELAELPFSAYTWGGRTVPPLDDIDALSRSLPTGCIHLEGGNGRSGINEKKQ